MSDTEPHAHITLEPGGRQLSLDPRRSLLESLREHRAGLPTVCGGQGTCGKCRVLVQGPLDAPCEAERNHLNQEDLDSGIRLGCQTRPQSGQTITVLRSESGEARILTGGKTRKVELSPAVRKVRLALPAGGDEDSTTVWEQVIAGLGQAIPLPPLSILRELPAVLRASTGEITLVFHGDRLISIEPGDTTRSLYGMAFDIGTTTVVGYLVDLATGKEVAASSCLNPQRAYGEDLVSRLSFVQERADGLAVLQGEIISTLNRLAGEAARQAGVEPSEIYEVVLAGNVVMHHLLLGIDPSSLARAPYRPVVCDAVEVPAGELGLAFGPQAQAHVLPNVSGFVGADMVATMLTVLPHESPDMMLVIDLGTNGEIALGSRDRVLVCSTAAGPAFEGARIRNGMRAARGAIDRITIDSDVHCHVLGGGTAAGICGSGLLDAVAQMLGAGILSPTGRLLGADRLPADVGARLRSRLCGAARPGDEFRFVLSPLPAANGDQEIAITQQDIRELQLAKGAIYAGIQVLKKELGIEDSDIQQVVLAGAFGSFVSPASACSIGLIPPVPLERVRAVGNAAGLGAQLALISTVERRAAAAIARRSEHIQLSGRSDFQEIFMQSLHFPGRKTAPDGVS